MPPRFTASSRLLALLFAAALLWAQMLGLAHAVLHGPQAQAATGIHEAHVPDAGSGLLEHLSGHADRQDSPDCKLWDQLGQAAALVALPSLHLPQLVPFFQVPAPAPQIVRDLFAPYGARAPPQLG